MDSLSIFGRARACVRSIYPPGLKLGKRMAHVRPASAPTQLYPFLSTRVPDPADVARRPRQRDSACADAIHSRSASPTASNAYGNSAGHAAIHTATGRVGRAPAPSCNAATLECHRRTACARNDATSDELGAPRPCCSDAERNHRGRARPPGINLPAEASRLRGERPPTKGSRERDPSRAAGSAGRAVLTAQQAG